MFLLILRPQKEKTLSFNDAPFGEVLRKISRRYNVIFEVRDRDLLELSFEATFINESIEVVMNMLETVSPIKYNQANNYDKIYLKSKIIIGNMLYAGDRKDSCDLKLNFS
jgi:hypothetical protein